MTLSLAGLGALLVASADALHGAEMDRRRLSGLSRHPPVALEAAIARHRRACREAATRGIFGHAFVVTALNPKSIAFFVAFVPQFIDHGAPLLPQLVIMEATFVVLAAPNALAYALAADQLRVRIRRPGVLKWLNRTGAGCLVGMGVATAAISRN